VSQLAAIQHWLRKRGSRETGPRGSKLSRWRNALQLEQRQAYCLKQNDGRPLSGGFMRSALRLLALTAQPKAAV